MVDKELYKDIPDFKDYQVSNLGNVKSLKFGKQKILKPSKKGKYLMVILRAFGKQHGRTIHQLVAMAFLNHKPKGHTIVVDHIDNDPLNNNLNNLQLLTNRENCSKEKENVGATYCNTINKWISRIQINGKHVILGRHDTEQQALDSYNLKLKEI